MRQKLMAQAGELFFARMGLEQRVVQINQQLAQITQEINNIKEPDGDATHDTEQLGEDTQ